ncbi:MAG TPA: hypothetical protein VKY66_03410 [Protaetiibacter sp.]|nr:hypothetical protein [Protaetiibacter sp.]
MPNRSLPSTAQLLTPVAAGVAVILVAAALTGCSQLLHQLHQVHEETYASHAEAARAWVGVEIPAWIPDDATELRNHATDDETHAVVAVTSGSEPIGCVDGPRRSLPFATPDWAGPEALQLPDGGLIAHVLHCGDYEVIAHGDGWLGWFTAQEPGQTPS